MKKRISSKNYSKLKYIDIIAILIIGVLSFLFTISSGIIEEELKYVSNYNNDLLYLVALIICLLPTFLGYLALYFGVRHTIRKVEKKNLTYNATRDILYYRNILNDLTPFEVSILANLNVEEKKDITATILWYKNKKYLDIKNEKIIFYDNLNLSEKDKYFITFLKTGDLGYLDAYKNITYSELQTKKYIIENSHHTNTAKHIIKNVLTTIGLILFTIILVLLNVFYIKNMIIQKVIDLIIIIIDFLITYKMVTSIMVDYVNRKSRFKRTKLGDEKATYIHALQNFIHDFSNLKEYNREQVIIWEDFLIYAIVLEQNDKIIYDIAKFFKNNSNNDLVSISNFFNIDKD